jgi:hypothetical protein
MNAGFSRAAALAVALVVPCQPADVRGQDAATAVLAAERGIADASDRSGFATAVMKALGVDAVLVWPGAPVAPGRAAPRLLAAQTSLDSLRLHCQPLGLELSRDSGLAVTWGVAVVTARTTPSAPRLGRYIQVWRWEGGRWASVALLIAGVFPPSSTIIPSSLPIRLRPLRATGPAGPFIGADLAFAKLAGDSGAGVAFERWAAPDAVVVDGSGLLVRGPRAVGGLVAGPAAWRWHPVAGGGAESGDLGWTVGEAVIVPPGGAPIYSKYLTVWRRVPDGSIRFLTDGGNPRPTPPE